MADRSCSGIVGVSSPISLTRGAAGCRDIGCCCCCISSRRLSAKCALCCQCLIVYSLSDMSMQLRSRNDVHLLAKALFKRDNCARPCTMWWQHLSLTCTKR